MELADETFYDRRESSLDIKIENQQVRPTPDGYNSSDRSSDKSLLKLTRRAAAVWASFNFFPRSCANRTSGNLTLREYFRNLLNRFLW